MKNKLILAIALITTTLIAIPNASACGGCKKHEKSGKDKKEATSKKVKSWTCSMHPEVKSPKPGKCPVCSMALIPASKK